MVSSPRLIGLILLSPLPLLGCDDSRPVSETMMLEDTALDGDATTDDTTPAPDGDDTEDTDTTGDGDALDAADTSSGDTSAVDVDAPSDLGDTRDPDGDEDTAVADVDDTTDTSDTTDTTPPACLALGVPCTVGDTCCDDAVCDVQSGVCRNACLEVGATCEFDGDCCTGDCDRTNKCCANCEECPPLGTPCGSHDECCDGTLCLEGMCQIPGTP